MNQVVLHSSTSYGIFSQEKYMVGTSVQNLQSKLMDLSPVLMERPGLQYKDMNMIRCCENFVWTCRNEQTSENEDGLFLTDTSTDFNTKLV